MKLEQYPKYKESGVPWIKEIPEHWDVLPNRAIFEERNIRGMIDEDLLSVTIKRGVIRQKELIESSSKKDSSNEDKSKYKLVMEGDLPYNKMRMWQGAVGVSKYRGIVSPAYIILKPRENAHADYFHYLLRTTEYTKESQRYSYGICDDQLSLRFKDFKVIKSILPSVDEQKIIASFIRSKERKIAQFIRNKRRLIQLLKEQKQIIINQAVTRGIDPNVKLKPSGVEWLGDIPKDWEARRLKYSIKGMLQYGANEASGFQEEGDPRYVRITDINSDGLLEDDTFCTIPSDLAKPYILEEGDILFARSGATVGKTFCYRNEWGLSAYAGYLIRAKIDRKIINHEYLYLFTKSNAYLNWISSSFIKATIQNISAEKYASLWITLPPRKEQDAILLHIQKLTKPVELAISRVMREIKLIQEYRIRLISDVVTGKLDVRNIKVEDVSDEELIDDLSPTEEIKELEDSVGEVPDED